MMMHLFIHARHLTEVDRRRIQRALHDALLALPAGWTIGELAAMQASYNAALDAGDAGAECGQHPWQYVLNDALATLDWTGWHRPPMLDVEASFWPDDS